MKKIIWFFLGNICAFMLIFCIYTFISYQDNIHAMLPTQISYKGTTVETFLSADVCDYLETGDKKLYFSELPSKENAIEISSPRRATITVYHIDEKSILINYRPRRGLPYSFIKSNYGDFNDILLELYENTKNEVFLEIS